MLKKKIASILMHMPSIYLIHDNFFRFGFIGRKESLQTIHNKFINTKIKSPTSNIQEKKIKSGGSNEKKQSSHKMHRTFKLNNLNMHKKNLNNDEIFKKISHSSSSKSDNITLSKHSIL